MEDTTDVVKVVKVVQLDDVLPVIGEFGLYQKLLDLVLCLLNLPVAYQALIMYFSTMTPAWKCKQNSSNCLWNGTLPGDDSRRCHIPRNEWEYTESRRYSFVTAFNIHCEDTWILYLLSSMFFIGWGCGAVVLGYIGDNFGRKTLLFPSLFMLLAIGLLSSFLNNVYAIVVCRFFIGFFTTGTTTQGFILMSELVSSKYRPFAGIIIYITTPIGWCILALKAYLIRDWKILSVVCTAPYMVFIVWFYWFIPESIKWLQSQGKEERVMETLNKIAHWNKTKLPANIHISSPKGTVTRKSNPLDIFRTRKMAFRSSVQAFIWCGTTMTFYGLHFAASELGGSGYRDFVFLNLSQIPSLMLAIAICNYFGRKVGTLVPSLIGSLACFTIAFLPLHMKTVRVVLGIIGQFVVNIAFNSSLTWATEIFPTHLRAEGVGVLEVFECLGSASSPWVAKGLQVYGDWIPFAAMGLPLLIAAFLGTYLPETKDNRGIEDDYENETVVSKVVVTGDNPAYIND